MITAKAVKDVKGQYLSKHLRSNDYWAEGEKIEGEWFGLGAELLGLKGIIGDDDFEALRKNEHPSTSEKAGEQLTERTIKNRVSYHDIQISAPKDVSVLAMIGDDERVLSAYKKSVRIALKELETFASVRNRKGQNVFSEKFYRTGNMTSALFFHDASRKLDPQLHAHAVTANATWDDKNKCWKALQPAEMLRASGYVRQVFYTELSGRLQSLGYQTHSHNREGFEITGLEHLRDRFSKRRKQIESLASDFEKEKGNRASKKEIEIITRESRDNKLSEITTPEVRKAQLAQLSESKLGDLKKLVSQAKVQTEKQKLSSKINYEKLVNKAYDHVFERKSIARESEILDSALQFQEYNKNQPLDVTRLRSAVQKKHGAIYDKENTGFVTMDEIVNEEQFIHKAVKDGKNVCENLGDQNFIDKSSLSKNQKIAIKTLANSKDRFMILEGDAGTGKTYSINILRDSSFSKKENWLAFGVTTGATEALQKNGFSSAKTLASLLNNPKASEQIKNKNIILDEAGLCGSKDMKNLCEIMEKSNARLIAIGDTKQHSSVSRGNGLGELKRGGAYYARLSEVRRQKQSEHKDFSQSLAFGVESGNAMPSIKMAQDLGILQECKKDFYQKASDIYLETIMKGGDSLAIAPTWDGIERFTNTVRKNLKENGYLDKQETQVSALKPLRWTEAEKKQLSKYKKGIVLAFHRSNSKVKAGTMLEISEIKNNKIYGKIIGDSNIKRVELSKQQSKCFTPCERSQLALAKGDKIQLLSNYKNVKSENLNNGSIHVVDEILDNSLKLVGGSEIDLNKFQGFTYGYALTSFKSQGASKKDTIALLDQATLESPAVNIRQNYVSNTRFIENHTLLVEDIKALEKRLALKDTLPDSAVSINSIKPNKENVAKIRKQWAKNRNQDKSKEKQAQKISLQLEQERKRKRGLGREL